jgi:ParB family chromosome partitioning protein
MGYERLASEFDYTHDELAKIVGKSRTHVTNTLRLLKLSEPVKAYIHSGKLSAGHARMLIGQPNAEELAAEIVDRGLNVRQVEAMARKDGKAQAREVKGKSRPGRTGKDADTVALEKRLSDALGLQVSVDHRGEWGILQIHYRDLDQLDAVLRKLEGK